MNLVLHAATLTRTHARPHTSAHAHTNAQAHVRMHARMHARTHGTAWHGMARTGDTAGRLDRPCLPGGGHMSGMPLHTTAT